MLNSFLAAAVAGAATPAARQAATQIPVRTRENGLESSLMAQPSLSVRCDRVEDWREPSTPILATEASRAFVPPCTRADAFPGRQLSDQALHQGAGTLATNSPPTLQLPCQGESCAFASRPAGPAR